MESPIISPVSQQTFYLTPFILCLSILVSVVLILIALHFLLKRLRNQVHPTATPENVKTSRGVDKKFLDSILKIQSYRKELYHKECYVCLSGLEGEEMVRLLPQCGHVFHAWCIDQWFEEHSSCPTCRMDVTEADYSDVVVEVAGERYLEGGEIRRSSTFVSDDMINDLMSFREKIRLKRCLSLDAS